MTRKLDRSEVSSARDIQAAIDSLAVSGGGRLQLPEIDLELDRGLALRSGVALAGEGDNTVLRKGAGRIFPLSGYHNYGMCDVPLRSADGIETGMTVSIHDDRTHGGFYETFAVIAWVDGDWVGLDRGVDADYRAEASPCLTTVYPLLFGHEVHNVEVRDITLEGNRGAQEKSMGSCRGGAIYFANSRDIEITGISERDYHGEGLSFQMCRDVRITDCRFDGNSGNGMHPGAGSTNALFQRCSAERNEKSGFYFCVRANHITVEDCGFASNGVGLSIGTRDCYNRIDRCTIEENAGPGVQFRKAPRPTEVHSCVIADCVFSSNAGTAGEGQIEIVSDAHDIVMSGNMFSSAPAFEKPDIFGGDVDETRVVVVAGSPAAVPSFECGYGTWPERTFRHLRPSAEMPLYK